MVKNTIFAKKTFTYCLLLLCKRMPCPKFCGENFCKYAKFTQVFSLESFPLAACRLYLSYIYMRVCATLIWSLATERPTNEHTLDSTNTPISSPPLLPFYLLCLPSSSPPLLTSSPPPSHSLLLPSHPLLLPHIPSPSHPPHSHAVNDEPQKHKEIVALVMFDVIKHPPSGSPCSLWS